MSYTIPSDTHVVNDTGHTSDHNNLVDVVKNSVPFNVLNTAYSGGADPTGTADSTAAINAAITAAGAGGTTFMPPGSYKISGALLPLNGSKLLGLGPRSVTVTSTSTSANGVSVLSGSALLDVTLEGFTLTGPSSGSGVGIFASANSGAANVERLALRNLVVGGWGSHGIRVQNAILSQIAQVKSWFNLGRGFSLETGTTWTCYSSWASNNASERGWYLSGLLVSDLISCGSDNNALGYEILNCSGIQMAGCDGFGTVAAGGLDGSTIKVNGGFGINILGPYIGANAAVGLYVTGGASGVFASGVTETATGSPTASIKTDAGTSLVLFGVNLTTGPSYSSGTALFMSPAYTFFSDIEAGVATVDGLATLNGGTATAGSAPVLTPTFVSGTAAQLSDTTRDYEVYLQFGAAGTAMSVAIGPTSTPANTLISSAAVTAGEVVRFRVPAGWFTKVTFTTTTLAHQIAIGC